MEVQKNKIKIWDRIPPSVLIPLVVIGSLGAAAFLIWLGIKLAPVELLDPEKLSADKQQEEWRKKRAGKDNGNDNDSTGDSTTEYEYDPARQNESTGAGDSSGAENTNSAAGGNGTSADTTEINSASDVDSADNSNTNSGSGVKSAGSSSAAGNATYTGCTYPTGDINVWWHSASLKQRDCYISKHGVPVFSQEEPYFCDYENSKDCYYMEYK